MGLAAGDFRSFTRRRFISKRLMMDDLTIAYDVTSDMAKSLLESDLAGKKVPDNLIAVGRSIWAVQLCYKECAEIVLQAFEIAYEG